MTKKFTTWRSNSVEFLSFSNGQSVTVVDELGGNYGTWESVERFRKLQIHRDPLAAPISDISGDWILRLVHFRKP